MKTLLMMLAALLTFCISARTFELTAWRGETLAARVPDYCELGDAPKGLDLRLGVLKLVKFAPEHDSLQRSETYDRVTWNAREKGPRVVEISVPAEARAGDYVCGMMTVHVLDRVLPPAKEWKYYLDLWQHPWAVARMENVVPFSAEHYAAMRPVYELLATAGQKTITVTLLDQPWDHQCADAYRSLMTEDFKLFDDYVEFCRACGLGPDISCYSLCPWTLGGVIDPSGLEKRWGAFMDRFVAHLKAKGWYRQTIMAMDEREPEDVVTVANFVRRHAPEMRISMAGNRRPSEFRGVRVDSYSQSLHWKYLTPEFLGEASVRAKAGLVTTFYVCCDPVRPNTFMASGVGEAFWCGAAPAFLGLDGFLRWAWNSWPCDPVTDASYGHWKAGDTFLCYPKGEPSWRFLELRNGIIAAEKLRILKERELSAEEIAPVAGLYDVRKANEGVSSFREIRSKTLELVNRSL